MGMIKICLNCGDKLLENSKKCPTCGEKAIDFPLVDKEDKAAIEKIVLSVPHPKGTLVPKWNKDSPHEKRKEMGKIASSFKLQADKLKKESEAKPTRRQQEKQYQKDRMAQIKRDKVPYCPKCKSTSLTHVDKKLSVGRAVVGGALLGGTGAVLGGITSKKGKVKCLNCGNAWKL